MTEPITLRAATADLRKRVNVLPSIKGTAKKRTNWIGRHRARQDAAEALAIHLRQAYGARVSTGNTDTASLTMLGIRSSSTGGLASAYTNWLIAADKRLADRKTRAA